MLACDQAVAHRFSVQAEQFSSRYRGSQEPQDLRVYTGSSALVPGISLSSLSSLSSRSPSSDLLVANADMYTESDAPAKVRKMSPSPVEATSSSSTTTSSASFSTASTTPTDAVSSFQGNSASLTDIANNFHSTSPEDHGSEAPPHPSPEVLPPVSAAQAPESPLSPQQQQPQRSQSPPTYSSRSPRLSPPSPSSPIPSAGVPLRPPTDAAFPYAGRATTPEATRHASYRDPEQFHTVDLSKQDRHMSLGHHQHQQLQQPQPQQQPQRGHQGSERLDQQTHSNHDRGHNSDSDSTSSAHGDIGKRYREQIPEEHKDVQYWEKRRRNNEAARKSREKRRIHDMVLEGRITSLESANTRLRRELLSLKERYNLPDSFQFPENEEEDPRDQGYKSDSLQRPSSTSGTVRQQHHQQHQQQQPQHRLSLDSMRVTPPAAQEPLKPRSLSFSAEHHHMSRPLHSSPLGMAASTVSKPLSGGGGHPPYTSPPPLLAVTGAVPMGVGVFPGSAPSLPAFLSEASKLGHHEGGPMVMGGTGGGGNSSSLRTSSPPLSHLQHTKHYSHQHHSSSGLPSSSGGQHHKYQHQQHVAHLPGQALHPNHRAGYSIEPFKNEPMEEGEVRARERSNSSVERRPSYLLDQHSEANLVRRSSLGNYSHYRSTVSPQGHHPYLPHHPTYPGPHSSPGRNTGRPPFPQHRGPSYEGFSHSQTAWAPRSPISSHSSDENYDEPLQLTVRRDSGATSTAGTINPNSRDNITSSSMARQQPPHDDSSRDSDSMPIHRASPGNEKGPAALSSSPPSSLPLKMRHKLPPAGHEFTYPKELFPSMASAAVSVAQPSFPPHPHHHPFMNGLAHLSDMAFPQSNPLSLIKADNSPLPFRQQQRREGRSAAARRAGASTDLKYLDPKYLERRRRNNEAARKCRENRKTLTKLREAKSDYLESENGKLREELGSLQEEMKQLRELIEKKRLEQGIKEEDLPLQLQQPHIES